MRPLLIVLVSILTVMVGCAPPQPSTPGSSSGSGAAAPQANKRVVIAVRSDPRIVSNVVNITGGASQSGIDALEQMLHAGLVFFDEKDQRLPQLAEAVPSIDNGLWKLLPDGKMETTWTIKDGVRWQDGAPFTSEDLAFTVAIEQDRDFTILNRPEMQFVERVDTPDPRTVVVTWNRPYIDADTLFTYALGVPLPKHLLAKPFAEDKGSYLDHTYWTDGFVGLGPYKLGEWVRGSHLIVTANDAYVLGRPKIQEIEVRFIPDLQTLSTNMLSGQVELVVGRASFSFEQGAHLRDQWRDGTMLTKTQGWVAAYPQFVNPTPAVMADVRFRRALLHALDRQQMAEILQLGNVGVAHSIVGPNETVYPQIESSIVKYDYDQRRAVQLIEGLGFTRAGDGMFQDSSGQPLALELRTTAELDIHLTTVYPMADAWRQVGVAADPLVIPPQRQTDKEFMNAFPAFHMIGSGNSLGTTGIGRYYSSKTPLPENNFQAAGNYSRYMNPEMDRLLDRYFSSVAMTERVPALAQVVHHMTDQLVQMGLFYNGAAIMVSNRLQNVTTGYAFSTGTWNAYLWDVKS